MGSSLVHIRRAAAILAVALTASACGVGGGTSTESGNLTMTVWTADETQLATLDDLASEFSEEHDGTSVRIQTIPQDEYLTKLSVRLSGGNPPDLGWLGAPDVAGMAEAGRLADLSDDLESDEDYAVDDFVSAAFTNWQLDDGTYGVPFSTSPFFTLYNKDLLAEAGLPDPAELASQGEWTWERFAEIARRLQPTLPDRTYTFESNEGAIYGSLVWTTLDPLLRAHGTSVYDPETGQCQLNSNEAVDAVELYHQMVFEDGTAVPPGTEASFWAGDAAFTFSQLSRLGELEGSDFDWGVTELPGGPGGEVAITGQAGFVVFEDSPNKELATKFLKFLTSKEGTEELAKFFPPARDPVLEDASKLYADSPLPQDAVQEVLVPGIREGKPFPYPSTWAEVRQTAEPIFGKLWRANADVPAVLNEICEQVEPVLSSGKAS